MVDRHRFTNNDNTTHCLQIHTLTYTYLLARHRPQPMGHLVRRLEAEPRRLFD